LAPFFIQTSYSGRSPILLIYSYFIDFLGFLRRSEQHRVKVLQHKGKFLDCKQGRLPLQLLEKPEPLRGPACIDDFLGGRLIVLRFILGLVALSVSVVVMSTPVGPMSYQGRLLDANGVPHDGSADFIIRIYDSESGGTLKYQETKNASPVNDGVYTFNIGEGPSTGGDSAWDVYLWQQNLNSLFLELSVNGETLSPRSELTSSPHAFTATLALSAESLGGKTAAEYDNILEGICESAKGRWLNIAEKCLGVNSDFSVAAVGGVVVNITTLHSGTDFTDLDLSGADISGIEFSNRNLSGTHFIGTTYSSQGVDGANLSNTVWDGATDTYTAGTYALFSSSSNLDGATFKNMSLAKWYLLNGVHIDGLSAAELTACPYQLTSASWFCREQYSGSGRWMLLGPNANLSSISALASDAGHLNTNSFGVTNLRGANFDGVTLTQSFYSIDVENATFVNATLKNTWFRQGYENTDFTSAAFDNVRFTFGVSNLDGVIFDKASLEKVRFLGEGTGQAEQEIKYTYNGFPGFNEVSMRNVSFEGGLSSGIVNFQDCHMEDIVFDTPMRAFIVDSYITGNLVVDNSEGDKYAFHNHESLDGMETSTIQNAVIRGDLRDVIISETAIRYTEIFSRVDDNYFNSTVFATVAFQNVYMEGLFGEVTIQNCEEASDMVMAGDWRGATISNCDFTNIRWVERDDGDTYCPHGIYQQNYQCPLPAGNTCDGFACNDF